jgi:A/G-specific adenine glycosylase
VAAVWTVSDPAVSAVIEWWAQHARPLPWRARRDVYAVWVSEVMSAQTPVGRVAPAWERWMARWPSVEALAAASLADVLGQWQGLGYPRRARDLHHSARIVRASGWPEDLTELPGVGPYVAAAIRCFAFEQPVLPRDVNVTRVLQRRFPGGIDISGDPWRAGQALMEFGQRLCARRPRCVDCPVSEGCPGPAAAPRRAARTRRAYEGSVRQRRGRLLRQVLTDGRLPLATADREIAQQLASEGLVAIHGDHVLAPP